MPKIGDWQRRYWRNASGDTVLNRDDRDLPDEILALYENARGDIVTYEYAPEDAEGDYVVRLNGDIVEGVTLGGEKFDDEEFEQLVFDTRARAREAAAQLRRQLPPIEENDDGEVDYDNLQDWAKAMGIPANQGSDQLREAIGV